MHKVPEGSSPELWFRMQLKTARSSGGLNQDGQYVYPVATLIFGVYYQCRHALERLAYGESIE